MSQSYNNNTKRPKLKNTKLVILKIYTFCQKIKQKVSDPGESAAGVTSQKVTSSSTSKLPQLHFMFTSCSLHGWRKGTVGA